MYRKTAFLFFMIFSFCCAAAQATTDPVVRTANGLLQGRIASSGIRTFKGVPYAQPPVGALRWVEPQPPTDWKGTRQADHFGPQAMQNHIYSDMIFRSDGMSEDCLYLNIWAPPASAGEHLPVLVYFYGGGFAAGDGSEPRYDGENMATKGVVTITVNYRLGVFGFLAHPDLTRTSMHHASGNYGLMDQHAALVWVHRNIAAFGGDPGKVTIAGESAGSMSVCAQMASPLSRGLFRGAIGESGAVLGNLSPQPLKEAEENGQKFMSAAGAASLADLRQMPADKLLAAASQAHFSTTVDGYFFTESPAAAFAAGKQMRVPLLAGWNSAEVGYRAFPGIDSLTVTAYTRAVQKVYGDQADKILRAYPAASDADVEAAATQLASDRFIAYATWKWTEWQNQTGGKPVYRYLFAQKPPGRVSLGAPHASDIPYCMGNLPLITTSDWTPDDYKASAAMQGYFAAFIKTGSPNTDGLPAWPSLRDGQPAFMVIDAAPHAESTAGQARYLVLDGLISR